MDYLTHNVSENLHRIRKARNMSLDQLAEQSGVSKSMLAQIERGSANPSIGVLGRITSGLRIDLQELVGRPPVDYVRIDPLQVEPIKELAGQYCVRTCLPYEDTHEIELYHIELAPGGTYCSGSHGEKTREYLYVASGSLTVEARGHIETVPTGQIYIFETDCEHIYRNPDSTPATFVCFFLDYFRNR